MERDTQQIEIATHRFSVKTYATAREANAIQQAYFKGTKLEVVGDQPKISEFNPGVQFEVQQEMIRQMVTAMDENAEGIVERCLELPNQEFGHLVAALDEIASKKKQIEEAISHYSMGRMDPTMQAVAIMQEFSWTYEEYLNTPRFILTLIVEKMRRDRKEQELEANM